MILIIFLLLFIAVSFIFIRKIDYINKHSYMAPLYVTEYIKGTARGSMGKFISNSMLEHKRKSLDKNSKF